MHTKLHDRLVRAVEPTFEPGERAEFTGIARVTSARRNAMVRVAQRKKVAAEEAIARAEAYLVLTDRRMLVVGKGFAARPRTKVLWVIPRSEISPLRFQRGILSSIDLGVSSESGDVRLTFPRNERREADRLALALDLNPV